MASESARHWAEGVVVRAALVFGALGLIGGLVRGLTVYAPTAWAAAFEVGIPSAIGGSLLGLLWVGIRIVFRTGPVSSASGTDRALPPTGGR